MGGNYSVCAEFKISMPGMLVPTNTCQIQLLCILELKDNAEFMFVGV